MGKWQCFSICDEGSVGNGHGDVYEESVCACGVERHCD
jgi:hypothetical protein